MPPQQVGGRRGTSSLQLSRLRARQGQDAKEKAAESAQGYNGKGALFQPHLPRTILRGGATKQHTATTAASTALSCTGLLHSLEAQATTSIKSIQAPNANSSSLKEMSAVVVMIFRQIMTELSGAASEEDRLMAITKIVLKLIKQIAYKVYRR
jgi:hypothetical protein